MSGHSPRSGGAWRSRSVTSAHLWWLFTILRLRSPAGECRGRAGARRGETASTGAEEAPPRKDLFSSPAPVQGSFRDPTVFSFNMAEYFDKVLKEAGVTDPGSAAAVQVTPDTGAVDTQ